VSVTRRPPQSALNWRSLLLMLVSAALMLAVLPASAPAIGRHQAARKALRTLHARDKTDVIVFGMRKALRPRARVDVLKGVPTQRLGRRLGRRTWLFWEDLSPDAMFAHASELVLVDARTGRVHERSLEWWPLINGRPPPFLTTSKAYHSSRWQVFSSHRRRRAGARAAAAPARLTAGGPIATAAGVPTGPLQITPANVAGDCLILVGLEEANLGSVNPATGELEGARPLPEDFNAMRDFANSIGLKFYPPPMKNPGGTTTVPPAIDNAEALDATVTEAINNGCRDVFIFLAGHGTPRPGLHKEGNNNVNVNFEDSGPPSVLVKAQFVPDDPAQPNGPGKADTQFITPENIKAIEAKHPNNTFKVKIVACFAGNFSSIISANTRVAEFSSAAREISYFHLDGADVPDPAHPSEDDPQHFKHIDNTTNNPTGVTEFTNRDIHGLTTWAHSQTAKVFPDLGSGIALSFAIGEDFDFAATEAHWTHPGLYVNHNLEAPPPPSSQPPPSQQQSGFMTHIDSSGYDHTTPGNPQSQYPSTVCADFSASSGQDGTWTAMLSGGRSASANGQTVNGGRGRVVFGIPAPGDYTITVTVTVNGQMSSTQSQIHVPSPSGGPNDKSKDCSAPPPPS
jgi:hypothetical protein